MDGSYNLVSANNSNPFELFFELSADLLCIAGFDGYFKKINPAVSSLLGYTNEELMSRPINDFVHTDDKEKTGKVRAELVKGKALFHFENRYVTKSGETVWLSWTSMNIDTDKLIFAIAKNITHKKQLEKDRDMLLANMTRINKQLKELTYTASHDLRAPVNNLLSLFEMLDTSKIEDVDSLKLIDVLKNASNSLKQTLNGYVDILKEKEGLSVTVEEVNFKEVLDKVLESINSLVKSSKTTIHIDFSELPEVKFNKAYLYSIFLNLLTNAIKYSKTDCLPVINIVSCRIDGSSQLSISDNCIGFDMERIKGRIFKLHERFHDSEDSKGIGLYLVYNHITSLGGTINLESKIHEGSKFTITFQN